MSEPALTGANLKFALGFFDRDFYLSEHSDIDLGGLSPFDHYLLLGWKLGYNPSEKFDGNAYLKIHDDVAAAAMNPLLHYALAGRHEARTYVALKSSVEKPLPAAFVAALTVVDTGSERVAPLEGESLVLARSLFDPYYYLSEHPIADLGGMTAFEHYLLVGWKIGFNPSAKFDGVAYLMIHPDVAKANMNPLVHYALAGRAEKRILAALKPGGGMQFDYETPRAYFSEKYYLRNNPGLDLMGMDPYDHYMTIGWKKLYNPQDGFNTREYLFRNPDVESAGANPLAHYACFGVHEGRQIGSFDEVARGVISIDNPGFLGVEEHEVLARAQDFLMPMDIVNTDRLCVFVVPEHNAMSGGIFSMFSLANQMRRLRHEHGYDVIVMTRPNAKGLTYIRNSSFRNSETVYRLDQLRLFRNVRDLQLQVPEYACVDLVRNLSSELMLYLLRRDTLHINVLNQNIRFMPDESAYRDLRRIATSVGLSAAHHAYATQEWADRYQLPTLLLPAYTDLTEYPGSKFSKKENLIIISDDDAPYRGKVEEKLRRLGDYEIVTVRDMTFDKYMDLATRCRFSVSFGEGFDGYVAQPIYQGGIGFALYTDEFFPNRKFLSFENFFATETEMIDNIVRTIRRLEADEVAYERLNASLRAEWEELYSVDDYVERIGKLIRKEYETYPKTST